MQALNPIRWLTWLGEFVQLWFVGIPWRDAPKAIPAVILSVVLFTTGFIAFSGGAGWRNRQLDRQLRVSFDREDYETAEIVMRRQLEADPTNVELIHRFALIREAQSFEEEATVLMRRLLARRHLPSAKWLLDHEVIGTKVTELDPEQLDEFGEIYKLITENEPENIAVKRMYAQYLIFRQRLKSAIPLLDELSEIEPMLGLHAAQLARQLGEKDSAELYAKKTLDRIRQMKMDDPANAALAINIARNQIFLERHSDAIRTLQQAVKNAQTPQDRRFLTQLLGDAIVAYVNYIEESPSNTITERLRVLRMLDVAVQIAPNNPRVITMVADHVLGNLHEDNEEIKSVRQALISGSPAGIAHFIKGTSSLMKKDHEAAELHLGLAAEQMPRSGAILNNLAVALAHKDPPEYERALEIANAAIDNVPNPTPHFYETRGQLLFLMGRFREAISDLERALREPKLAKKAHQMLADCYDRVGEKELADGHRAAAEQTPDRETIEAEEAEKRAEAQEKAESSDADSDDPEEASELSEEATEAIDLELELDLESPEETEETEETEEPVKD